MVRSQLAKILGCQPDAVELLIDPKGKPYCPSPNAPYFNISHCHNQVALAVCSQKIGIDIERNNNKRNIMAIAKNYYADSELKALQALPPSQQAKLFYQLWVLKEAIAKATGKGLGASLNNIELEITNTGIKQIKPNLEPLQLLCQQLNNNIWMGVSVITKQAVTTNIKQLTSAAPEST